ncbi:hypothetical protein BACCAC_02083 [Bacteroides caccae ATCC 43185]|nr:hypothetical protein BACCAC_02083 [Bacteroides caccae ATCC 43185]
MAKIFRKGHLLADKSFFSMKSYLDNFLFQRYGNEK